MSFDLMSFDPTKPVQCRDGRKARILATDHIGRQPIVAAIGESVFTFNRNGRYWQHDTADPLDLVNIPEEKWRPWKEAKEVPALALFKWVHWVGDADSVIIARNHAGFRFQPSVGESQFATFEQAFESGVHSTDLGKTWHKCGVKIQ